MLLVRTFNLFVSLTYVSVTPPGWQKAVRTIVNSMYCESLEAKAKQQYRDRILPRPVQCGTVPHYFFPVTLY